MDATDCCLSGQLGREESVSAALTEFYSVKSSPSRNLDDEVPGAEAGSESNESNE